MYRCRRSDAGEGLVLPLLPLVIRHLDIHRGNIIGHSNLIGPELACEFAVQITVFDQVRACSVRTSKTARAGKRVNDMNARITEARVEFSPHDLIGAFESEIHQFHRRIGDAQTFRCFRKRW